MLKSIKTTSFMLLIIIFSVFMTARSKNSSVKPKIKFTKINREIKLTGKLDNPLWKNGTPVELKYEIFPGENTPAGQKTKVTVLYSKKTIYFGFKCNDSNPKKIRANLSDRDKIFHDDHVAVYIDTYGDHEKAYGFLVNPFGIQADSLITRESMDTDYNMTWESAAFKTPDGWTAEIAIPLSSLKFPNKDIQNWALNLYRILPRASRHEISWTKMDRAIPSPLIQMGLVTDLKGIKSKGNLEILPYILGQQVGNITNYSEPESGMSYNSIKGRIGTGLNYSPNSNFSLEAVINPDFSQIESDASQISVNTTFALFYPEKRPFFQKGQELLRTPMYYSRSINDPSFAGRILGKNGALSYQLLTAYDRNTIFIVPGEEESNTVPTELDSLVNIGALRYDLGNESHISTMVMTKSLTDAHNYLIGLNWNYKFWKNCFFAGEGFLTHTKEMNNNSVFESDREFGESGHTAGFDGETYSGEGIHLVLAHQGRNFGITTVYNDFSPTYQALNGFFSSNDVKQFYLSNSYNLYFKDSFITRCTFNFEGASIFNHQGVMKNQMINVGINLLLKGQTQINFVQNLYQRERFRGVLLENYHISTFSFSTRPVNAVSFSFNGNFGKSLYRDTIPKLGKGHSWGAQLNYLPSSKIDLSVSYNKAYLENAFTEDLFYDGYIWRIAAKYQFSSKIFFRAIVDYDSFSDSLSIYPLFSYKAGPFTTFFAGITNTFRNYGQPFGMVNYNRQYFIKLQYLIK